METPIKHIRIPTDITEKIEKYGAKHKSKTFSAAAIAILKKFFEEHPEAK